MIIVFHFGATNAKSVFFHPRKAGLEQPLRPTLSAQTRMHRECVQPRPAATSIADLKPASRRVDVGADQPKRIRTAQQRAQLPARKTALARAERNPLQLDDAIEITDCCYSQSTHVVRIPNPPNLAVTLPSVSVPACPHRWAPLPSARGYPNASASLRWRSAHRYRDCHAAGARGRFRSPLPMPSESRLEGLRPVVEPPRNDNTHCQSQLIGVFPAAICVPSPLQRNLCCGSNSPPYSGVFH